MAGGEGASAAQRRRRRKEEDPGVRLSKALSYVLRHGAAAEGLPMGPDGFVEVPELELTPLRSPGALPPTLAHGTRRRLWGPIRAGGLRPMGRQHLHLAGGLPGDPGVHSGMRSDSEIAIIIDGPRALADGIPFFRSANGVILTPGDAQGRIPPKYFLRVLQLRPRRCELPLDGPWDEERGETPG
ncbi:tRNA 2'-phosphotransferase 1 isoform X4 [Vidua chalybeata]|uniref:tRNA 2'-phosphotransferase 1 isoform X4 n=1 Tax=Vidua chalybeata TaxID=81927 RepID=UPI0023A90FE6|nr:tRNA 2'-phosphotransferase 1 isoform X4 [Vidua chalybeata]